MKTSQEDFAGDDLLGMKVPRVLLCATDGTSVDLRGPGLSVVYAYPRTSPPDGRAFDGWDEIPGARGCTPQSCAFRDHFAELRRLGVSRLFGLSTQPTEYQKEAADRLHLPFPLLCDSSLSLANALNLPTFEAGGLTLLKRLTMIIEDGTIKHVFYPVHLPDENADAVISWLAANYRSRLNGLPTRERDATRLLPCDPRTDAAVFGTIVVSLGTSEKADLGPEVDCPMMGCRTAKPDIHECRDVVRVRPKETK